MLFNHYSKLLIKKTLFFYPQRTVDFSRSDVFFSEILSSFTTVYSPARIKRETLQKAGVLSALKLLPSYCIKSGRIFMKFV